MGQGLLPGPLTGNQTVRSKPKGGNRGMRIPVEFLCFTGPVPNERLDVLR
jgi:hypothetical protein